MAKGLVIHIGDGDEQRVEIWTGDTLRVGVSRACEVRLRDDAWEDANVELELERRDGHYCLAAVQSDAPVTFRQRPVEVGDAVDDGGAIRVGDSLLAVRFLPVNAATTALAANEKSALAPFIQEAALESAASGERTDAIFFLRELGRELWRELRVTTKVALVGGPLALLVGATFLGVAIYRERTRSLATIAQQSQQIAEQDRQLTAIKEQQGLTDERLSAIDRSQQNLQGLQDKLNLPQRLWRDYHRGVCLVTGVYQLLDPNTGQPLRYPETNANEEGETVASGAPLVLTTEGRGALAEYEFVGTGFYVGGGFVLTNRHVVQPWTAGDQPLAGRPAVKFLRAYFPGHRDALPLLVKLTAQAQDLAVCTVSAGGLGDTPALPLATDAAGPSVGSSVTMMGYPSGPDRLLALLSEKDAQSLQKRYGSSLDSLLRRLAELNLIKPLTTQGNITDTYKERVVFDASTSAGGSGGPLFGPDGRVIGVSFGVFTENNASNFGVPVANALALLQKAGWRNPAETNVAKSE